MNPYIPWDVNYLTVFLNYVKGAIGSATSIGILIFAVIMGILIVIAVVRKFTH